jgi:hypothetical protein
MQNGHPGGGEAIPFCGALLLHLILSCDGRQFAAQMNAAYKWVSDACEGRRPSIWHANFFKKCFRHTGGSNRWSKFETVEASIVTGGQLFGMPQDSTPRRMLVATTREWASVTPYGADDQRTDFTATRIAIEKIDGTVVKERLRPSEHAEGRAVDAPWDALDRAYFNGYALWTYLTTPFHFAMPGFDVEEIAPWHERDESWRGLRVTYPPVIASHSRQQDFYFGSDFLLRRHDYHVEASGGFAAAQYVFDPVTV